MKGPAVIPGAHRMLPESCAPIIFVWVLFLFLSKQCVEPGYATSLPFVLLIACVFGYLNVSLGAPLTRHAFFVTITMVSAIGYAVFPDEHADVDGFWVYANAAIVLAAGFFVYDVAYVFIMRPHWTYWVHATVCAVGFFACTQPLMQKQCLGVLTWEVTTILLDHVRHAQDTRRKETLQKLFYAAFFVVRVCVGTTFIVLSIAEHVIGAAAWDPRVLAILGCGMCGALLNLFWFYKLTRIALHFQPPVME